MSRINAKGLLSGAVGPVYFRVLNGKPIVQSKPGKGKVKQAPVTKANASFFGKISSQSKAIRLAFSPLLQELNDSQMYRRFTAALYQAAMADIQRPKSERTLANGNLSLLKGFQFNIASPFSRYCQLIPEIACTEDNRVVLSIPESAVRESIVIPANAALASVCFSVIAVSQETNVCSYSGSFHLEVPSGQQTLPAMQWETPAIASGQLVFVISTVFFSRGSNPAGRVLMNSKSLHPCEIVGVFVCG